MRLLARTSLTLALVFAPAFASAQGSASAQSAPAPPPPGGGSSTATDGPSDAPAASASGAASEEKKAPTVPAAGYAYTDKPKARATGTRFVGRRAGPTVNLPGFEQLPDGGSRLFVAMSQSVPVEERRAQGSITYILKGANARVWNNTNALVTVHFNTPVTRARLVPHGHDLHFVVDLRAATTPQFKMNELQDKSAMLTIDFPRGDFSAAAEGEPSAQPPPAKPKATRRGGSNAPPAEPAPAGPKP